MRSFTILLAGLLQLAIVLPGAVSADSLPGLAHLSSARSSVAVPASSAAAAKVRAAEGAVRSAEGHVRSAKANLSKAQSAVVAAERRLAAARINLSKAQAEARAQAATVRMPRLLDMPLSQANAAIAALPISMHRTARPASTGDTRIGKVVSQSPPPGTAIRKGMTGQIVYLVPRPIPAVPTPPAPPAPTVVPVAPTPPAPPAPTATVVVPKLIGRTIAEAASLTAKAGLQPKGRAVTLRAGDSRTGRVVAQSPGAGARVRPRTVVTITYGNGSARPTTLKMPSLIGKTQGQALTALRNLGIAGAYKRSYTSVRNSMIGKVVAQSPKAGTSMQKGQKGYFTIQTYKAPTSRRTLPRTGSTFTMPDIMGKTYAEARNVLGKMAVMRVSMKKVRALKPSDAGKVVVQSPKARSTVSRSATVYLTVAQ